MAAGGETDEHTQLDVCAGACVRPVAVQGGLFHVNPAGFMSSNRRASLGFQTRATVVWGHMRGPIVLRVCLRRPPHCLLAAGLLKTNI